MLKREYKLMNQLDKYLNKVQRVQEIEPLILGIGIIGATAGIINAINFTFRTYKEYLTKAGRACTDLTERERSICMLEYKIKGREKQIHQLKMLQRTCTKHKKAQMCRSRFAKEIQDVKKEIHRMHERIKALHKDYEKPRSFKRKITS